jgi:hypothetical protein
MAEKKIADRTYKCEPLLLKPSLALKFKLMKLLAPGLELLPAILSNLQGDEAAKIKANQDAISAIKSVLDGLEFDEAYDLMREVVEVAKVKRASGHYEPVDFEGDFSGVREKEIVPVMLFVLREQFADFFSDALEAGREGAMIEAA